MEKHQNVIAIRITVEDQTEVAQNIDPVLIDLYEYE